MSLLSLFLLNDYDRLKELEEGIRALKLESGEISRFVSEIHERLKAVEEKNAAPHPKL